MKTQNIRLYRQQEKNYFGRLQSEMMIFAVSKNKNLRCLCIHQHQDFISDKVYYYHFTIFQIADF
jgi:hypothetical protein